MRQKVKRLDSSVVVHELELAIKRDLLGSITMTVLDLYTLYAAFSQLKFKAVSMVNNWKNLNQIISFPNILAQMFNIFLSISFNICFCVHGDDYFEYPHHMFWLRINFIAKFYLAA